MVLASSQSCLLISQGTRSLSQPESCSRRSTHDSLSRLVIPCTAGYRSHRNRPRIKWTRLEERIIVRQRSHAVGTYSPLTEGFCSVIMAISHLDNKQGLPKLAFGFGVRACMHLEALSAESGVVPRVSAVARKNGLLRATDLKRNLVLICDPQLWRIGVTYCMVLLL